ncbi:coenzyme F420-reducing hydrogenase alpha subunit [Sulfuritortus calidifontis]|uniref:Coenzyme F420-reducing hydrogenase alpha subunit n=1 Tax=Sulfuritortus calidifontis TaxID=1914471 RepID=A0A4R3K096_9PROT|nr:nickel-dependent hydrogenase large subunit [Sulfuritortus calidifontis]TCS73281.1 coenzyme F420-reducing hydrogenase alpha subunit [Sulfuritortus calidifontis]
MAEAKTVSLELPLLARVEGEGALEIAYAQGRIAGLKLRIFEPPRYFEKLLEGRHYSEVPDIVARICGLCPAAYQMSAVQALEAILGLAPTPWISAMRRLFYCGEWIESHCAHLHLLAAPDFFGCGSVVELAAKEAAAVRRGLKLQNLGNRILKFLGGRSIHPVGARVGGFWRAPGAAEAQALLAELQAALPEAEALLDWVLAWPLPESDQVFESVALRDPAGYAIETGRIASDRGLDIGAGEFERHFSEHQVPHSTAFHCLHDGRPYLVGPLARLNVNSDRLPLDIRQRLHQAGIALPSRNPFHSAAARAVEVLYALREAVRLLSDYAPNDTPYLEAGARAGCGCGVTEAPRGILWHRYELDEHGLVRQARIVPPTAQNQARIEADLAATLAALAEAPEPELRRRAETVIRNYDPCISCATHFLTLKVER